MIVKESFQNLAFRNYKELIDVAFENIVNQSKKYFESKRYEMIFPNKSASNKKA